MRITSALAAGVIALGMIGTTGCESGGGSLLGGGMNMVEKLTDTWNLSKFNGVDIAEILPETMRSIPSMTIGNDGKVSGTSGLNRFTGGLDLEKLAKGEFDLGPLASTKMGGSDEAMGFEQAFFEQLQSITGFTISEDTLTLLDQGREALTFIRGG